MNGPSSDARGRKRGSDEFGTTRRAVLAAGGAVALTGLAGCAALDGLLDRAGEQVVGTTASAPAAFYPGRTPSDSSASLAGTQMSSDGMQFLSIASTTDSHTESDERQVFRTSSGDVRQVPATARAEGREINLEGWSTSGVTKAQDYNSSRSNKPSTEWWVGPDDVDDDDSDADGVLDVELELLGHVMTAQDAVGRRAPDEATRALDAFINATTKALRPALDKCGTGVCETVRANSEIREQGIRRANGAVDEGDWTMAVKEIAGVEEIVLGDIERLDDVLVERQPSRPRFIDIIQYMRGEPTIGERFTVCLPNARGRGDQTTPLLYQGLKAGRVLAYFVRSHEADGVRAPFHDQYGTQDISYDDEGCIQLNGPISLHRDLACGNILSAELDTYRTANRGIVGFSTDGGAVVSGAPASADIDGKCVFVAADGTLREPTSLDSWPPVTLDLDSDGDGLLESVSQTLVCPVTVTPADCPCPLPGLFYVRRIIHDDQIIFAGGWTLDEGALYDGSATLLFEEGPTEIASVTPEDIGSDDYNDRIVEQFSRDRSRSGSAVISGEFDGGAFPKEWTLPPMLQTEQGRKGLNAVNVKVVGEQGGSGHSDDGSGDPIQVTATALDAPLVHLAGARELSTGEKFRAVEGMDSETEIIEYSREPVAVPRR